MQTNRLWKSAFCFFVVVTILWGTTAFAIDRYVNPETGVYRTIQEAITAADPGDVVLIADGVYTGEGNVNLLIEKAIAVKSENGPEECSIDCGGISRAFTFSGAASSGAVLSGITITGGNGQTHGLLSQYENWGGAILVLNSGSITISDCTLLNNVVSGFGGAIASVASSPVISRCIIENNSATGGGGGLFIYKDSPEGLAPLVIGSVIAHNPGDNPETSRGGGVYSIQTSATFYNCLIAGNSAIGNGGAFFLANSGSPSISHCTISSNSVSGSGNGYGGGAICSFQNSSPVVNNSILWGNMAAAGAEVYLSSSTLRVNYSDLNRGQQDGNLYLSSSAQSEILWGDGNIDQDPLFVAKEDYHLSVNSPCIDSGIDLMTLSKAVESPDEFDYDIEGDPRVVGDAPDMGADEFVPEEKVIRVDIEIKPGCWDKRINLKSWGLLSVAVKTTESFEAGSIDPRTVKFAGAKPVWRTYYDLDRDRDKDVVFFFMIHNLVELNEDSTEATLTGMTKEGKPFEGTDAVNIIKPKGKAMGWRFGRW